MWNDWVRGFVVGFGMAFVVSTVLALCVAPLLKTRFASWIVTDEDLERDQWPRG